MDPRTVAALFILDPAPMIEAGDFRKFKVAESMVRKLAASAPSDWRRGELLYHLDDQLDRFEAPDQPECDGYLRAVRAVVRHVRQQRFECALLRGSR